MSEARARAVSARIQEIVAEMLERRVKDPRLGFVTITDVRLTGDLREASIFYTVFGDEDDRASTAAALTSATGLIRSEVGRILGIRHAPSITFFPDAIPENAAHIESLLRVAAAADAEVHERAEGATPAGEADPYRHPVVADEADDEVADDEVIVAAAEVLVPEPGVDA
jgi:ribosome-binding factor A